MYQTLGEKLFLEQEGVRQSIKLGLDFRGSRKSGFNRVLEKQLRGRPFRDFQVAAPLKPSSPHRPKLSQLAFRDFQVAAPLKLGLFSLLWLFAEAFPRLPSRGPIEALVFRLVFRLVCHFPRLPSRGPIEAGKLASIPGARRAFRDFQVAAPLKHALAHRCIEGFLLSATSKSRPH